MGALINLDGDSKGNLTVEVTKDHGKPPAKKKFKTLEEAALYMKDVRSNKEEITQKGSEESKSAGK